MTFFIKVDGVKCASCVAPIEQALLQVPGVEKANMNFATETVTVNGEKSLIFEDLKITLESMGYHAQDFTEIKKTPEDERNLKPEATLQVDMLVAFGFAIPLFFNMFLEMMHSPYAIPGAIQLVFASIVQFWPGHRLYTSAFKAAKRGYANMDTLVVIGTTAAYAFSLFAVIVGSQALYFEASAVVIAFVLLGRYWETKAKHTAREAVRSLMEQVPETAWIKRKDQIIEVFLSQLKKGDIVIVKAWELIPVDGKISQGQSEINEAMVTGEARPTVKKVGEKVIGGTLNGSGTLNIEVTAIGAESTLSKMIKLVEQAQASRPPIQQLVDKVASIFVPFVIALSLLTFFVWLFLGFDFDESLIPAIAVLVIACPCALGLATPLAVVVGIGSLAKKGVVIKDLRVMEVLTKLNMVVFDKTGTLTRGEFKITKTTSFIEKKDEAELTKIAASLQQGSEHLLAIPFVKKVKHSDLLKVTGFKSHPGKGIEGKIGRTSYALGSKGYMKSLKLKVPTLRIKETETIIFLAKLGAKPELIGCFYLEDTPRASAGKVIRKLEKNRISTYLLTGDINANAQEIAKKLSITNYKAEASPAVKLSTLEKLRKEGHVLGMVGDGVNDAPALATADVGFAMGSGTDVALEAAPVTLMRPNLELIPISIKLSHKVMTVIKQNLFWAFIFNIFGIGLAAFGMLSPMIAGAAMAFSSVAVVLNSLRLRKA